MMWRALLAATLAFGLAACETTTTAVNEARQVIARKPVVEVAAEDGQFSTLVTSIRAAGLDQALQEKGPFTLFAPTDTAFAKLPDGELGRLLQDKAKLAEILKYHVVQAEVTADKVLPGSVRTLNGASIETHVDGKKITVNDAAVTRTNIMARNGVIHAIDKVLTPPPAK